MSKYEGAVSLVYNVLRKEIGIMIRNISIICLEVNYFLRNFIVGEEELLTIFGPQEQMR